MDVETPRGAVILRRRVTLALLASVHDALSTEERAALHALDLGWYAQGPRVESRRAVDAGGEMHHRVLHVLARVPGPYLVAIPVGATRCWVCGCTDGFACQGRRGCGWWRPGQCTECEGARASVPRRPLERGALALPLTPRGRSLDDEERDEREGKEAPPAARGGRRRPPVGATRLALPGPVAAPHLRVRDLVRGQLEGLLLPAVAARGLALADVVALAGPRRHVSPALRAPLAGDPDEVTCVVLGRRDDLAAALPGRAAGRVADLLARRPRGGLLVLWWGAAGAVEVVHLADVTDAAVAGRRAS
jgi:hypothetical protein